MTCEEGGWHDLWAAYHRSEQGTATLRVSRKDLAELVECHGSMPDDLIHTAPRTGSDTVLVNKPVLYQYLVRHGRVACNAK